MDKDYKVDIAIILFAMRYAMGRESYASTRVIENIKYNLNRVDNSVVAHMIDEIDTYSYASDDIYVDKWLELQSLLQETLLIREAFNIDGIQPLDSHKSIDKFEHVMNVLESQVNSPTDIYSSQHDIDKVLSEVGISSKNKTIQECYNEMSVAVAARRLREDIKNKE